MHIMQSIPYEILQLVSSNLLPKYQCRLALVSQHCYRYLYNDLLKWHSRKDAIVVPKYRIMDKYSIMEAGSKLIYNIINEDNLAIENLTTGFVTYIDGEFDDDETILSVLRDLLCPKYIIRNSDIRLFDGFYKYIRRDYLTLFVSVRMSPLLSLPLRILSKIVYMAQIKHELWHKIHPYIYHIAMLICHI